MAKMVVGGPTHAPSLAMVETLNTLYPPDHAQGIMDNGCGSGLALSLLIQRYGSELPDNTRLLAADFSQGMIDQVRWQQAQEVERGNQL